MSQLNFRTYRFKPYHVPNAQEQFEESPSAIMQSLATAVNSTQPHIYINTENMSPQHTPSDNTSALETTVAPIPFWQPSTRLRAMHTRFENTILFQYICVPCVYCSKLLYPTKAKWIPYDENVTYPLQHNFPQVNMVFSGDSSSLKVSVCSTCSNTSKRYPCPQICSVPLEIEAVPLMQRRFLSPVFLHCSLGRSSDGNSFSQYRTLTGDMTFSKNMRALQLYSGMVGAFLEQQSTNEKLSWLTPQLLSAANWLKEHNCYLRPYGQLLSSPSLISSASSGPFPTAHCSSNDPAVSSFSDRNIVLSSSDFPSEIHDEDCHYTRLMAGFVRKSKNTNIPISFNDPELEPLLFPDLFPDGRGHYHDISNLSSHSESTSVETYGKYIKHRLLCVDSRFRLHPYWPSWSYLQLEKLRNHQNTMRLWRQQQSDSICRPPTAAQLITRSVYTGQRIIDETMTTTLPTFIRTGDTYFHEKLLHVDAMINEYGLPTLFITLTMAEGKWTHLRQILKYTDNGNALPTNRPLHSTLHFTHRKQELKRHIWSKPANSQWGDLNHFFERVEFQNRGAAHTHSCIWVSKTQQEMITEHVIRSDLPNPQSEPELFALVKAHQIHTCSQKHCGGPMPPGQMCRKNFPRPYAPYTYYKKDESRYIYRCVTAEDQWVVPYHASTLLIWNAHMNVQYVSSRGLGRYLTKYVVKPEPSNVFNISDGDQYRQHIIARHLGSMECMFLLLGLKICNSSVTVKYLPTDQQSIRSRAIRPIATIDEDDDDPYWKDHVEKYFARPHNELFDNITYPDYFKNYRLCTKIQHSSNEIYKDDLNYFVIKRSNPIVVRFRYLKVQDGEAFFYQWLLKTVPCRSEQELLGGCMSYREHFLKRQPDFHSALLMDTNATYEQQRHTYNLQFSQIMCSILEHLGSTVTPQLADILTIQLNNLKHLPPILPHMAVLGLPEDQYVILNTITENLGPVRSKKYPYFFITGSAGTGKSYMINLIIDWLKSTKCNNYLLMAPTGIAAINICGQTIHSTLRLTQSESGFKSLALHDKDFKKFLCDIQTLIIDEVSMVAASLLTFIADLFASIHNNHLAFGGINVLLFGDLAQLPPVKAQPVFFSTVWHLFYPLFLRHSKRQEDIEFYNMLEEIRFNTISQTTWNKLHQRASEYPSIHSTATLLTTTHIVGHRTLADQINQTICNSLPVNDDKFLISNAIDFIEGKQHLPTHTDVDFKSKTNLPSAVRLQQGARVMFLNNSFINEGICNGTIGVITDVNKSDFSVQVAFCIQAAVIHKWITRQTSYFHIDGQCASRTQFPVQNSFALTVHKTQSLTLPQVAIDLSQLFCPGQAYTSISRCKTWDHVQITGLHKDAFIVDEDVIKEYERLEAIAAQPLHNYITK